MSSWHQLALQISYPYNTIILKEHLRWIALIICTNKFVICNCSYKYGFET